jgi:hypothetical protein
MAEVAVEFVAHAFEHIHRAVVFDQHIVSPVTLEATANCRYVAG